MGGFVKANIDALDGAPVHGYLLCEVIGANKRIYILYLCLYIGVCVCVCVCVIWVAVPWIPPLRGHRWVEAISIGEEGGSYICIYIISV